MTNSPKPPGGMPTWLIVIIVIFLVIVVGCCGGAYMCTHFLRKVAIVGEEKIKEAEKEQIDKKSEEARKALEQAQKQIHDAETQQAQELKSQGSQPAPGDLPTRTDLPKENTTPAPENKSNGADATAVEPAVKATKLPSTFPNDIPIYKGLVPTFSLGDKVAGSATVIFNGPAGTDPIADFYEKQMPAKNWKEEKNTTLNDTHVITYSKDARSVTITITNNNDKKSLVEIIYTKQ